MLLQVLVTSKQVNSFEVQVNVKNIGGDNVILPCTSIKEHLFGHDKRVLAHFVKLRPESEWGGIFELEVSHDAAGDIKEVKDEAPEYVI